MSIEALEIGRSAEFSKTITEADIVLYAGITGDFNPVRVSDVAAKRSRFGGRVAHGMLTAGLISTVLGTRLPGPGAIYVEQTLRFRRPVRIGDTITARAEVVELDVNNRRAILNTVCLDQNGKVVLDGRATVLVPEEG